MRIWLCLVLAASVWLGRFVIWLNHFFFSISSFDSQYYLDYTARCRAQCTDINTIPAYENANSGTTSLLLRVIVITSVDLLYLSKQSVIL